MMRGVHRPEKSANMLGIMQEIKTKILQKEQQQPIQIGIFPSDNAILVAKHIHIQIHHAKRHINQRVDARQEDIVDSIAPSIVRFMGKMAVNYLP